MLAAVLAAACTPPAALRQTAAAPSAEVDSARARVRALVDSLRLPGFSITVSVGSDVIWREGFGFADVGARTAAGPETLYRIGSVSKLLTVSAMMRLVQAGRVDLDAPIGNYLTLPATLQNVTLRQLAGHLAGVRHYRGNEFFSTTHFATLRDAITVFVDDSLIARPGTRYAYSSFGYNLIGAVLEAVSGIAFPDLMRREVLEPLAMSATRPDTKGEAIPKRAHNYVVGTAGATDAPDDDLSGRLPSGGFLSSTDDLAKFGRSIFSPGRLTAQSIEMMLTPQRLASGAVSLVGLGWRISADSSGRRYLHHGGTSNGGSAFLLIYPDQRLVVAMAANAFAGWGERDARAVASILLRAKPRPPS